MRIGDLVREPMGLSNFMYGIILETQVNMWNEEVTPPGVRIMWQDGDISVVYEDEIEITSECH